MSRPFTWLEFIEATTFLNHYWLVSLVAALLAVVPANRVWSIDARSGRAGGPVPIGAVWVIRLQLAAVYFFAGIAKLHPDWLLDGAPLAALAPRPREFPLIGPLLAAPGAALALSWAGALSTLPSSASSSSTDPPLGLGRRGRLPRCHLGVVSPDRGVPLGDDRPHHDLLPTRLAASAVPSVGRDPSCRTREGRLAGCRHCGSCGLGSGASGLPLRHLAYPGDARWTGEGFRFAWNVLAVEKVGWVSFRITDPEGRTWVDDGSGIYTRPQLRVAPGEPDMIAQMALALAEAEGPDTEVRVDAFVSVERPRSRADHRPRDRPGLAPTGGPFHRFRTGATRQHDGICRRERP